MPARICGNGGSAASRFTRRPTSGISRISGPPKLYLYKGRYYLFGSFSSPQRSRGVSVLVSDRPDGGFRPLVNEAVTPEGWMCLDGTLYIDKDGHPWLIYARKWIEVMVGEVYAQRLSEDLIHTAEAPIFLFKGSDAERAELITTGRRMGIVTNAPFIYTTDSDKLLLLWSSFRPNGEYVIGAAVSHTESLHGPCGSSSSRCTSSRKNLSS